MHDISFLLPGLSLAALLAPLSAARLKEKKRPHIKAILLVAFGTHLPEAQKAFDHIDAQTRESFPGIEIRWAYTSRNIRAKLAEQGKHLDAPETALGRLMAEGYTHVAVFSLHVVPGQEFHDLYHNVRLFTDMAGGFERLLVALPLLSSLEDLNRVATVLLERISSRLSPEDAVLFIGHSNRRHPSDAIYVALNAIFQEMAPNVFVGTVSGNPTVEAILPKLKKKNIRRVSLLPLMAVAGEHACKDVAGGRPSSWQSTLIRHGFACETVLAGLTEYPDVVEIWMNHFRECFAQL